MSFLSNIEFIDRLFRCNKKIKHELESTQQWSKSQLGEELSQKASVLVSDALEIIEAQVRIEHEFVEIVSIVSEEMVMEASQKLEQAHKLHPQNPLLHYSWVSALHLARQYESAEHEMKSLAQSYPNFLFSRYAMEGWGHWESTFALPPWGPYTTNVHPAISSTVKSKILLTVRDGLVPRATMFLRDIGEDLQDIKALRCAMVDIATVINPIINPRVVGIYATIWDNLSTPLNIEALDVPLFPRGHKIRRKYEFLCLQEDIDFVVIDSHDRILLNKRLPISINMRKANLQLQKLLDASDGTEISLSEMMKAITAHQQQFSFSDVRY